MSGYDVPPSDSRAFPGAPAWPHVPGVPTVDEVSAAIDDEWTTTWMADRTDEGDDAR